MHDWKLLRATEIRRFDLQNVRFSHTVGRTGQHSQSQLTKEIQFTSKEDDLRRVTQG